MTPALRYHRAILELARTNLARGKAEFFAWVRTQDPDIQEDLVDAISHPALTLRPEQRMPLDDEWSTWLKRTGRGWHDCGNAHLPSTSTAIATDRPNPATTTPTTR